jgi:hypothetical protein
MEYIQKELSEAYLQNAASSQTAQLLETSIKEPGKAWMMIREIIRIAPQDAKPYTAIVFVFHKLIIEYGEFVVSDLETEGASNALLERCLKHVIDKTSLHPLEITFSHEFLNRLKQLHHRCVNLSPKKQFRQRDLPNSLRKIVHAWCVFSETFWAFDELLETITKSPTESLEIIVNLLNKTEDSEIIAIIAAGPLECLLVDHGIALKEHIHKYAIFNYNMRIALAGVWLDKEGDDFYPYWVEIMKEFGYWEMIKQRHLDEE